PSGRSTTRFRFMDRSHVKRSFAGARRQDGLRVPTWRNHRIRPGQPVLPGVSRSATAALYRSSMETIRKLAILADAAKYDASCASSGAGRRDSRKTGGIGSTEGTGICHSYTPDGRCVSLLKILFTNFCTYDCAY